MDKKQGKEKTEFVKEDGEAKREFIFQKNSITKTGTFIVIAFLVIIVIGLIASGVLFED